MGLNKLRGAGNVEVYRISSKAKVCSRKIVDKISSRMNL
jgi:hypothetical protein